jgi:3-hydroxyacyl-CoA dehydrogenase
MERLDYFAARAMSVTASMWNCKVVAKDAYFVAEAMMEERRKRKKVFEEVLALLCVEE